MRKKLFLCTFFEISRCSKHWLNKREENSKRFFIFCLMAVGGGLLLASGFVFLWKCRCAGDDEEGNRTERFVY